MVVFLHSRLSVLCVLCACGWSSVVLCATCFGLSQIIVQYLSVCLFISSLSHISFCSTLLPIGFIFNSQVTIRHWILPMQPSQFKFIKMKSLWCGCHQITQFTINSENQNPSARLKPLLLTILTSSRPHCPYQKDERAKPRNLLTKCSPTINSPLFLSWLSLSPNFLPFFVSL
jgi:hypothetical protein